MNKSNPQPFLLDKLIGGAYILFQLRIPYRFLNTPEDHHGLGPTIVIFAFLTFFPMLMTIPLMLSKRSGAYLFMFEQLFNLWAVHYSGQKFQFAHYIAIFLFAYGLVRLLGLFGPPLIPKKNRSGLSDPSK